MTLTAATIRNKLDKAGFGKRDNVARDIINNTGASELKALDIEAIMLLVGALRGSGWFEEVDRKALERLRSHSQFQPITSLPGEAVAVIKAATKSNLCVGNELSGAMVSRIYAAEKKRLSLAERWGIDGSTIGRGQLGQPAFTDVTSKIHYAAEWKDWVGRYVVSTLMQTTLGMIQDNMIDKGTHSIRPPTHYSSVILFPALEDFVVAGYLAVKMKAATKSGRSTKDVARFAVAVYHGMFSMVAASQKATGDTVNWAPVAAQLRGQGRTDEVAYVDEVVR